MLLSGLAAFALIAATPVRCDYRLDLGSKRTKITVQGVKDSVRLRVETPESFEASVFALDAPSRLVIDLGGLKLKSHQTPKVPKNQLVKGIRMAVSREKVRIVLDLKTKTVPDYSTSQQDNVFLLLVNEASDIMQLQKPVDAPTPAPSVTPTPQLTAAPTVPAQPEIVTPEPSPSLSQEAATVSPPVSATPASLESPALSLLGIVFDKGPDLALRLQLSAESGFSLTREKEYYLLSIRGCTVSGQHLLLPHYAPEGFSGINVVKSDASGSDLMIRLYAPRSTRLSAFRNGNEIWVRASQKP